MKKFLVLLAFAVIILGANLCSAQIISSDTVKVTVPFEFQVQGATLPAGEYILQLDVQNRMVRLGTADKWGIFVPTHTIARSNGDNKSRLVFTQENGKHILHQIWIEGDKHGHDLLHDPMNGDID